MISAGFQLIVINKASTKLPEQAASDEAVSIILIAQTQLQVAAISLTVQASDVSEITVLLKNISASAAWTCTDHKFLSTNMNGHNRSRELRVMLTLTMPTHIQSSRGGETKGREEIMDGKKNEFWD